MVQVKVIGVALLVVGLVCGIASTAIDYWYYLSVTMKGNSGSMYFGLWSLCTKAEGAVVCLSWSDIEDKAGGGLDWLHGCQAMMVIGVLLNATAIAIAIYATMKQTVPRGPQVAACIGGICYIIAAAIFGAKYEDSLPSGQTSGDLHAGFGLAIVAAIFNLIAVCLVGSVPFGTTYQNI